ncbi:MAG TPA: winged helix-turn-helix domain-containing protein [Candidatus Bathyarchaeia archaeon]|nr:winged helix-turn-helix domain-containing protein [Candidatus Bathyarchaeia archaeon]
MMGELKRSKLQICFNVLEVIKKGVTKPTRIMYGANLSWNTLLEVFMVLTSQGLIREVHEDGYKRYILTEKGMDALTHYSKALDILDVTREARAVH